MANSVVFETGPLVEDLQGVHVAPESHAQTPPATPDGARAPMSEAQFNAAVTAGTPSAPRPTVVTPPPQVPRGAPVPPPPDAGAQFLAGTGPKDTGLWAMKSPFDEYTIGQHVPPASRSAGTAAWKGLVDPLLGAPQFVAHALHDATSVMGENPLSRQMGNSTELYDELIKNFHDYTAPEHPELSPGSQIAGSVLTPTGVGVGKALDLVKTGSGWLPAIAKAVTAGLTGGATNPVDDVKKYWDTKIGDLGWSGGMGAGMGVGAKALGALIAPAAQKAFQALKAQGVDPSQFTLGQILGGTGAKIENFIKTFFPFSGVEAAQDAGRREVQVAPLRAAAAKVGATLDTKQPLPDQLADLVSGVDSDGYPVKGAIAQGYDDARKSAPLIPARAVPNNAGTDFRKNVGTPKVLNDVARETQTWVNDGGDPGKQAAQFINPILKNAAAPFGMDPANGQYHYADPAALHKTITYLNGRINAAYTKYNDDTSNEYMHSAAEQLEKIRDHLHDLWANTDQASFDKLRSADAAHSMMQTVQRAAASAAKTGMEYTPEQLIAAGAKGASPKSTAGSSNDLQRYAMNAQEVLGPPPSGVGPELAKIAGKVPALGGAGYAAYEGFMHHPAIAGATLAGLGGLSAASRYLGYGGANLGNKWANVGPTRASWGQQTRDIPAYLGGMDAATKP